MTIADFSGLAAKRPEKRLARGKRRTSGRNSAGRVTIRHRGGGHKRLYRTIDFRQRDKVGIPARVLALEYDPNRSARIALVLYVDGERRYLLAPEGLAVGDEVVCAPRTKVKLGNRMQLKFIPVGYKVFNVELQVGRGGAVVRSAGTAATLVGLDQGHAILEMPSGEVRKVREECFASVGTVSNPEHNLVSIGKAGRTRWLGRRPQVLGKSMNAVDHPHGGGEGHSPIGLKAPKTPWGKKALGVRTRRMRKSTRLVVRSRADRKRQSA
jgi:large subunit ribosomal protein L2